MEFPSKIDGRQDAGIVQGIAVQVSTEQDMGEEQERAQGLW
jgi:hypothetical protein